MIAKRSYREENAKMEEDIPISKKMNAGKASQVDSLISIMPNQPSKILQSPSPSESSLSEREERKTQTVRDYRKSYDLKILSKAIKRIYFWEEK